MFKWIKCHLFNKHWFVYCGYRDRNKNPVWICRYCNKAAQQEDLAQALSIKEAAKIAREFSKECPSGMIDADLGSGL